MSYNPSNDKAVSSQISKEYKTPNKNDSIIISLGFDITKTTKTILPDSPQSFHIFTTQDNE